jgi:hypothetical protein
MDLDAAIDANATTTIAIVFLVSIFLDFLDQDDRVQQKDRPE